MKVKIEIEGDKMPKPTEEEEVVLCSYCGELITVKNGSSGLFYINNISYCDKTCEKLKEEEEKEREEEREGRGYESNN